MNLLQPIYNTILNNGVTTVFSIPNGFARQSDFNPWIAATLAMCASLLCLFNYAFLQKYRFTKQQLESTRSIKILASQAELALFRYRPWMRVIGNALFKIVGIILIYWCESSSRLDILLVGIFLAFAYLGVNFKLLLKSILNPRSVFNRKHVWFRKNEVFFRQRVHFELFRRFIYFWICFTFLSYGVHRLEPASFTISNPESPLFIEHLRLNLNGMTSLGGSELMANSELAKLLEFARTLSVITLFGVFVSMVASVIGFEYGRRKVSVSPTSKRASTKATLTVGEIELMIQRYLEKNFQVPRIVLQSGATFKRMGIDAIEISELVAQLEQLLEVPCLNLNELTECVTISQMANLFARNNSEKYGPSKQKMQKNQNHAHGS